MLQAFLSATGIRKLQPPAGVEDGPIIVATSSANNIVRPRITQAEFSSELDSLTAALGTLQSSLLESQSTVQIQQMEILSLRQKHIEDIAALAETHRSEILKLKESCDTNICEANKIFVSKIQQLQLRCRKAENQSKALISSAEAANKSLSHLQTQKDEASVELSKTKVELLNLRRAIELASSEFSRGRPERTDNSTPTTSFEGIVHIGSEELKMFSPTPPSTGSRPSTNRPNGHKVTNNEVNASPLSFAKAPTLEDTIAEWRKKIRIPYTESPSLSVTTKSPSCTSPSPYKVNILHEIPISGEKMQKIDIDNKIFKGLSAKQQAAIRPQSAGAKFRGKEVSRDQRDRCSSHEKKQRPNSPDRVINDDGRTIEPPVKLKVRSMSYDNNLAELSSANNQLISVLKITQDILAVIFEGVHQMAEEILNLNKLLLTNNFKSCAYSHLMRSMSTEDQTIVLLEQALKKSDILVGKLLESQGNLLAAIPSSVDLENMFAKSGEDIGKPDENSNPKTLKDLLINSKNMQVLLTKSKTDVHNYEMQILSISKSKEDYSKRCLALETEVLQLHDSVKSFQSRDDPETQVRRANYDNMLRCLSDAINSLETITKERPKLLSKEFKTSPPSKAKDKSFNGAHVKFGLPVDIELTGSLVVANDVNRIKVSADANDSKRSPRRAHKSHFQLIHAENPQRATEPMSCASPAPLVAVAELKL